MIEYKFTQKGKHWWKFALDTCARRRYRSQLEFPLEGKEQSRNGSHEINQGFEGETFSSGQMYHM